MGSNPGYLLKSFLLFLFQHSCVKARVNGRDGVIVAGGASDADPSLNMVEFFDLRSHKWMSLGRTRQGRRFPGKGLKYNAIKKRFLSNPYIMSDLKVA